MRIYFVGSYSNKCSCEKEHFSECCREIGAYLAGQNTEFVVGSIDEGTADYYLVEGIKKHLQENSERRVNISLIVKDGDWGERNRLHEFLPKELFELKLIAVPGSNNHGRLVSGLQYSDVALLLAGGSGTFTTGVAAVAMKHPTLALPQFGGAASEIWHILIPYYARGTFSQADINSLQGAWSEDSPNQIATALAKIRNTNPFVQRIETNQIFLSLASLLCTTCWIGLFLGTKAPNLFAPMFFILVGLATALGSTTRNIVRCYFNFEVRFSLSRFVAEFVLGIVVAFMLFLIVQLGGVVVSGATMSLEMTDYAQFQRVAIAMSLVGFAASYLIETSLERLRGKLTGVLDETTSLQPKA